MNQEMLYRGIVDAVKVAVFVGTLSWTGSKIVAKQEQISRDLEQIVQQHRIDHDVLIKHDAQLVEINKNIDKLTDIQ